MYDLSLVSRPQQLFSAGQTEYVHLCMHAIKSRGVQVLTLSNAAGYMTGAPPPPPHCQIVLWGSNYLNVPGVSRSGMPSHGSGP